MTNIKSFQDIIKNFKEKIMEKKEINKKDLNDILSSIKESVNMYCKMVEKLETESEHIKLEIYEQVIGT